MKPFQAILNVGLLISLFDFASIYSSAQISTSTTVPFQVFLVKTDLQEVFSVECTLDEKTFLTNTLNTVIPEAIKTIKAIGEDQLSLTSSLSEVSVNNTLSLNITVLPTKQPTIRPTRQPTKFPTQRPTIPSNIFPTISPTKKPTPQASNLPTRIPSKRPTTPTTKNFPTRFPTYKPTTASSYRNLLRSNQESRLDMDPHLRRLATAQFIWGGSSSWTCRGCGPDMTDYNIYIPGEDMILDIIYGIRGPTFTERKVNSNITAVMQQEIDTRLNDPSITVGCLQNSIFSTYYKDLTILPVLSP
jgi:hypothetical protein